DVAGAVRPVAGKAAEAVGLTASKVAGFVGPAADRAAAAVGDYTRSRLSVAGKAISSGRAKLSGESASVALSGPEM
ncbi:MAG: hypothetical protein ACM30E_00210, partial [Nitrososphaerales archaeon]